MKRLVAVLLSILFSSATWAGEADVINVKVTRTAPETFRFDVTVRHDDEGWDHYANKWDIVGPDGELLGTRILYHPHVNEQPFTRSLYDTRVPADVRKVTVRAHDSQHGYGGKEATVEIP